MNKQIKLIAAVALAAVLGLGGCSAAASGIFGPGAPVPAGSGSGAEAPMAGMIHIESGTYRDAVPVAAGSMVTVMNMDSAAYTVTADDGTSFSVKVPAGAMTTFAAPKKPGSYPFHSDGNGGMHGVLTVR